jgi:hypothetical protein
LAALPAAGELVIPEPVSLFFCQIPSLLSGADRPALIWSSNQSGLGREKGLGLFSFKNGPIIKEEALNANVSEFQITIDPTAHQIYGPYYPVTYKFQIPAGSVNLSA